MKRFKNAGIAALVFVLSASITFGAFDPCHHKDVLAYDSGSVLIDQSDIEAAIADFEAYKEEAISGIDSYVASHQSARLMSYLGTIDPMGIQYNTTVTYRDNINSFDTYMDHIWDEISLIDDMDRFDAHRQDAVSAIDEYAQGRTSARLTSYLQTVDFMSYTYEPSMSYDSNAMAFDGFVSEVWEEIYLIDDMDRFDAYKQDIISDINSYLAANPSQEASAYLQNVDIMGFPYETSMSYYNNVAALDSYVSDVWANIGIGEDIDRFEAHRQDAINAIDEYAQGRTSARLTSYLQTVDFMSYTYETSVSYDMNATAFDNFVSEVWGEIYLIQDMDYFDSYKHDCISLIDEHARSLNIPAVDNYLSSIGNALMEYPYNTSLPLEANLSAFDDEVDRIYSDIGMQQNIYNFETYKTEILGSATPDTFVTDEAWIAYQNVANELRDFTYITNMSYEDNVSSFNTAIAAAVAQIDISGDIDDVNGIFEPINLPTYTFLDGKDSVWNEDSSDASEGLTFRCEGAIDSFRGILIDGVEVDPSSYTTYEGSTYCVLSEELLTTLSSGEHNLVFVYVDGISEVTHFTTNVSYGNEVTTVPAETANASENTTTTPVTTTAAAEATTTATSAEVLGETRETSAASVANSSAETTAADRSDVNTVAAPAEPSSPVAQDNTATPTPTPAASSTPSTGEANNGTFLTGMLLVAGAAIIMITRTKKNLSSNN
ncbi:MAG: LPXTG cell wall anchor domain-containing protein [Saccharofermentans sp.]|nr:LPXTG cell wall anchor domain-containing protein [Saccharofermentans sp.]